MRLSDRTVRLGLKPVAFLAALGPAGWLLWASLTGHLSANPLSDITNETGVWTLRFLCITLAITPLRRLTGWNAAIKFRRMTGLFAFFYGTLHFLTYTIVDLAQLLFILGADHHARLRSNADGPGSPKTSKTRSSKSAFVVCGSMWVMIKLTVRSKNCENCV